VAEAANLTTGVVRGAVASEAGQTLNNVEVVIEHLPSATVKRTTASADGNFFGSGLRPGGPYRITVRAPGYEPTVIDDYYVTTGSQRALALVLSKRAPVTEELVVRAKALRGMDLNNGLGSAYTSEDITNQPATKRDVIRTLLRDPLAQSDGEANLSVAGVNPRFNGFAIDGALQQDDFGLGSNTYATDRSPINIDAIESVSLRAADYSVVVSGFTGGLVNVTTKSGTNEFDGSVFYYYQDPDYIGDTFAGDRDFNAGEFEEEEYGFTLGGPILKDKLFFFVSYDEYESLPRTTHPVDE
jgi:Outer membrane receptor for ferrienterochelin and colicins